MARTKKKKSALPKIILVTIVLLAAIVGFLAFGPNTTRDKYIFVHTGSTYDKLIEELKDEGVITSTFTFNILANVAQLPSHIKPGRYQVKRFMSNYELVKMLRQGRQTEVKLVLNKYRLKRDLAHFMGTNLEIDSTELLTKLNDPTFCAQYNLDTNTILALFIPNSYEFYWNTNIENVLKKISKNYQHYWSEERKQKAQKLGLKPEEVITVASIIEEETNSSEDKPNIASVYLNRLKKGMKLQADPTVKYAVGDFNIRRIGGAMLGNQSPYNTYQHQGLPPGPICTPSPATIDAVLDAPQTKYIFFCAAPDLKGGSVFAATDAEHLKNARAYQKALNERGIH